MRPSSRPSIPAATLLALILFTGSPPIQAEQASPSPAHTAAAPTPIPLAKVASEIESAFGVVREVEESLSSDRASLESTSAGISNLTTEIDDKIAEDRRILAGNPALDLLYRLSRSWQHFDDSLSKSEQDLNQRVATLDQHLQRLQELNQVWRVTLQSASAAAMPPAVSERVQNLVNEIGRAQQAADSDRAQLLTLQTSLSLEDARIRSSSAAITRSQSDALKGILSQDSQPIWDAPSSLTNEWRTQSAETFSSQWGSTVAFVRRLPLSFVLHLVCIALLAIFIEWLRRRVHKLAEVRPALQQAVPILDLPVSAAFVLSVLLIPSMYSQAPRWIQAALGAIALVPIVLILRSLLERNLFPILYALVGMYFVAQLRVVTASLPVLARLFFLLETGGGLVFLIWFLRSGKLAAARDGSSERFSWALRIIARIGLIIFPAAILANILGYANLGNLLGFLYIRSIFVAALLYVAIRVVEGFLIIGLQVQPLGALRVVQLHRDMLHQRICRFLEFVAFLFWLNLLLSFFGLRDPLLAKIGEFLNANVSLGSINISLGRSLAFAIAVWASFLVSKLLRFLLEADVYQHFRLARGLPYAISTMLHYTILLVGFFVALGALGIDLTKITILAGAFSVGVGFGLQNVINNFVSGVILLFERPIKLGDVIEIGGTVGEVRRIGIRACVIRTADGSEIIVPNGSLISNQVTNWTFSDRARAIEVSVNILPGADSVKVVELLKTVAVGQAGLAKEPAPQVYVTSFTAGAITYQLRVWTDRYQDWAQVRSDLSVAISEALTREKIGIA
jgi:potassium-dependent mechanosensitive channel